MKKLITTTILTAFTLIWQAGIGFAGGFDAPFDVNPEFEMIYIKQRAQDSAIPEELGGILGTEGWSIHGNTLYGYFNDDNIDGLTASEIGSVVLDGSLGISNVEIAVDLKDFHDYEEFSAYHGQPLKIGSVTSHGADLSNVNIIVNIEGPIRY